MRNKILIVAANAHESSELENMLRAIVETGGELFFAEKEEDGLAIFKQEKPRLVFLDVRFAQKGPEKWKQADVHVVLMRHKHESDFGMTDYILKPLKPYQVLEKCRAVLDPEPAPMMPPM